MKQDSSYAPTTLNLLNRGDRGIVTGLTGENCELKRKLLDMGIVAGTKIEICAVAPLGDPITIKALGYSLSLRRSEASLVKVMPIVIENQRGNFNQENRITSQKSEVSTHA